MAEDRILAGYSTVDTFSPIQLFAGEKQPVSSQGTAASGYIFGELNARNETSKFPVVALLAGEFVPWDPTVDSNVGTAYASGTVTLSVAVPSDGETVTINGQAFTFRTASAADFDVQIGADLATSASALAAAINAHRNDLGHSDPITASAAAGVVTVRAPGDAGEAVTLAEAGTNIAVSGGTLTAGADADALPGGAAQPVAILPHYLDTSATGYNAAVDTPYFAEGVFNYDALDVPEGTTYAELKDLFRGSGIVIQKLY